MRISDWSSDVCSSDLQQGGRCALGGFEFDLDDERALLAGGGAVTDEAMQGLGDFIGKFAFVVVADDLCDRMHLNSRSEEHTSELQSLMRISYAVFCLKKNNNTSTIFIY